MIDYSEIRKNGLWNLGCAFTHDRFMFNLIDKCKKYGLDIPPIDYAYGGINSCYWHGGRLLNKNTLSFNQICNIIDEYNKRGIGVRLTFSRYDITEDKLDDEIGNKILVHCNSKYIKNGVIVSSNLLKDYIRNTYSNLEIISSYIKPTFETNSWKDESPEYYDKLCNLYDIVVANGARVLDDIDYYDSLNDHKSQLEFIVNNECKKYCEIAKTHYIVQWDHDEAINLGLNSKEYFDKNRNILNQCFGNRNGISNQVLGTSIIKELQEKGYRNFKIQGRETPINTFSKYLGIYLFDKLDKYYEFISDIYYK